MEKKLWGEHTVPPLYHIYGGKALNVQFFPNFFFHRAFDPSFSWDVGAVIIPQMRSFLVTTVVVIMAKIGK